MREKPFLHDQGRIALSDVSNTNVDQEKRCHNYATHRIPWFIRIIWVCFWIGLFWYLVRNAIPSAKNYF